MPEQNSVRRTAAPLVRAVLSVGEVAKRSGLAVSAIHFYEAQGFIKSTRTAGNQRRYPRIMLRRVAFIRASQRVGIPLARIKAALDTLPERRTPTPRDWARLSAAWCRDLDERISALQDLRDRLTGYVAQAGSLAGAPVLAAAGAFALSSAQRGLSTPARNIRRRAVRVEGSMTFGDGRIVPITADGLLRPLELALRASSWAIVLLAAAMAVARLT